MFQPDSRTHPSRVKRDSDRPEELTTPAASDNALNEQDAIREAQGEAQREQNPNYAGDAGVTGIDPLAEMSTEDDHPADSLADDDSAQTPSELYSASAAVGDLSVVSLDDIGAGTGLDEAELGRVKPLDGKRWDGNPDEPLGE